MAGVIERLIAAAPLRSESLEIDGFGCLQVRELSFSERQQYSEQCRDSSVSEGMVFALSRCVEGFDDISQGDLDKLSQNVLEDITNAIFRLSGLLQDSVDEAEGN